MLIVAIIALIGACVSLLLLLIEKSSNNKKTEELRTLIESNDDKLNTKLSDCMHGLHQSLSDGLKDVQTNVDDKEQALRATLKDNYDWLNDAIDQASAASKKYTQEVSDATHEKLAESVANLEAAIAQAKNASHEYTDSQIQQSNDDFTEKLGDLAIALQKVLDDNKELKKKLEFFTEIREDSMQLNEDDDEDEREALIQKALEEIQRARAPISTSSETETSSFTPSASTDTATVKPGDILDDTNNISIDSGLTVLDNEQLQAFHLMDDLSENMFITGKAGTGKSFLLEIFERQTKKTIVKLAPTGIAAINIGGATLHSAFGYFNLENLQVDEISPETLRLNNTKRLILKNVDTIIIDEISMVRADIFDKIDRVLKVINKSNKPFGGKQVLVFGDLFQLPPIAKGQLKDYLVDRYGGIYFFQADAYDDGNFQFVELSTNHRQKDDAGFFEILNRMREGKINGNDVSTLNTRKISDTSEARRILTLFPTKAQADEVNRQELEKIGAKEYVFRAKILYNSTNNQTPNLDGNFQFANELKLKLGALVMMVANDPNKRWVNGTLGVVSFISDDMIKVSIKGDDYEIEPTLFSQQEAIYSNGSVQYKEVLSVEQYPIVLAYAITIHKSQGMTYKKVACDITNCFASGQAYVALSRCTSLNGLFLLNNVTQQSMGVEEEVRDFYLMHTSNMINN